MSEIKFRLAKPCDAKQIAKCHWSVRERYKDGIFLSLGKPFLRKYYKIILNDPWEVIVCAEKKDGSIIGFSSGTQNAKSQAKNLKKHIFQLALSASFSVLLHPSLIKELVIRYKSLYGMGDAPKFITNENVRGEYWCWLPGEEAGMLSFKVDDIKNKSLVT